MILLLLCFLAQFAGWLSREPRTHTEERLRTRARRLIKVCKLQQANNPLESIVNFPLHYVLLTHANGGPMAMQERQEAAEAARAQQLEAVRARASAFVARR
jgi:hypothetical protein